MFPDSDIHPKAEQGRVTLFSTDYFDEILTQEFETDVGRLVQQNTTNKKFEKSEWGAFPRKTND